MGAAMLAIPAAAQTARPMLDHATAAKMRDACVAFARDHQTSVAIAIYDDEGRLVTYDAMDGVVNVAGELAQWKAKAAVGYRVATADMAKWGGGGVPGVATLPGGVPFFTAAGAPLGASRARWRRGAPLIAVKLPPTRIFPSGCTTRCCTSLVALAVKVASSVPLTLRRARHDRG